MDNWRGHPMELKDGVFVFSDTEEKVSVGKYRPCAVCNLPDTPEGHDPCLGTLSGVMNACCGHGDEGYIQFDNGTILRGTFRVEQQGGDDAV